MGYKLRITSEHLAECAEKVAAYGFTDRVAGHSVQTILAMAANQMKVDERVTARLVEELELSIEKK